jgi:hypothetical protein
LAYPKEDMLLPQTIIIQTIKLGLFYCSQLLFILPIILLSFQFRWILVLSLIAVRYISVWIIVGFSDKLKEDDLKFWFLLLN